MKKHLIILVTFMLMLGGCASQKTIYYWGDYSDAAYQFEKEPTEKTLIAYKTELLDIAKNASSKNKKVPPGIYVELAKLELEANNLQLAKQYLLKEQELFVESEVLVAALLKLINEKESVNVSQR